MEWAIWVAFIGGFVLGLFAARYRHDATHLNIDSTERKQMWIREGKL